MAAKGKRKSCLEEEGRKTQESSPISILRNDEKRRELSNP